VILSRALPPDVREDVAGDLEELYQQQCGRVGPARARRWYWRQSVSFITHFLAERIRERRARTNMSLGIPWIDLKLALRMLVRYPGLTVVAVLGMAVGITVAAAAFTFSATMRQVHLGFDDGDRIVSLRLWDIRTNNRELRALHDFLVWRDELRSIEELGAFRSVARNLISPAGQPEIVTVAEISASGLAVPRVPPLLGRRLIPDDERVGAADVVVIGYDEWRRRFAGDPGILGREVQLGDATYSIVGVMPKDFRFPVSHSFWVPLRVPAASAPRSGPSLHVFGRLAPGVTTETAQHEVAAIGTHISAASPATHEHLRPRVLPYTYAFNDMDDPDNALVLHAVQSLLVMLLVLVCVNVAILVYARTATRQGEVAVRTALGASRRRIVSQLFLEALVLALLAALLGIGLLSAALTQLESALAQVGMQRPFWMAFELSTGSILYVLALTVLAAAIVGAVPALKATGRRVQTGLQALSAGSGSRMQMGRLWTTLIVLQVAVTVALMPATTYHAWTAFTHRLGDPGYPAGEFLTTELAMEAPRVAATLAAGDPELRRRFALRHMELERKLEAQAAVAAVTFSIAPPGAEWAAVLEIEGVAAPVDPVNYNIVEGSKRGHLVRFNKIALDYFSAYGVPLLTGRALGPEDIDPAESLSAQRGPAPTGVVVDRTFVAQLLGGGNPLGRRVRYVGRSREAGEGNVSIGRWYEIVGVVPEFPRGVGDTSQANGRLYHAAGFGAFHPAALAIRVRGVAPASFAPNVRRITAAVDPAFQLRDLTTADAAEKREQSLMRLIGFTLSAVTLSVLLLSAAGIYALMSFTVARRRKEIGIRAALGADPARILAGIFSRVFVQLGLGAALGMAGAVALGRALEGEMFQRNGTTVLPAVALSAIIVGLLAALGPARRVLGIQPTEALREE
jgi:predicted permease